jgi:hypothetical protein
MHLLASAAVKGACELRTVFRVAVVVIVRD